MSENAAGGFGVTPQIAEEIFDLGADVLTTGNHVWDKKELRRLPELCCAGKRSASARECDRQ
jgi:calcineurin-like phosphoesterase